MNKILNFEWDLSILKNAEFVARYSFEKFWVVKKFDESIDGRVPRLVGNGYCQVDE